MEYRPLVSIIVTVYKTEKYLYRCINSIINQTYSNIEVILVNDGSPDKSPDICNNLAHLDSRIVVVNKENHRLSSARNAGLDIFRGDYVTFVDSDDFINKDYVRYLLSLCLENNSQISVCGFVYGSNSCFTEVSLNERVFVYNKKAAIMSRKIKSCVKGKLYKASLFAGERFPKGSYINCEDEALIYRLLYRAGRVSVSTLKLYYCFRSHRNTANLRYMYPQDFIDVLEKRVEYFRCKDCELYEFSIEYYCLYLMHFFIRCKKDKNNLNDLSQILEIYNNEHKKVIKNHVTPIWYKGMFICFDKAPDLFAKIINTMQIR